MISRMAQKNGVQAWRLSLIAVAYLLALSACQTDKPSMNMDEALEITAEFQTTTYEKPPRTVDDALKVPLVGFPDHLAFLIGRQRGRGSHASEDVVDDIARGETRQEIDHASVRAVLAAYREFAKGNYQVTLDFIQKARNALPPGHRVRESAFHAQLALVLATIGDADSADRNRHGQRLHSQRH